jgi:hypothetical protein
MSSKSQSRVAQPMARSKIERRELAGAIRRVLPRDGRVEMQLGLTLFRVSTPTEPIYGFSESSFCVIAEGAKHVMLGEDRFRYDPNHYLISTVGLPTISQIDLASSEEPYLGLRLILDPAVVTSTMVEAGLVHRQNDSGVKAIAVSALDPDLLNACLRLTAGGIAASDNTDRDGMEAFRRISDDIERGAHQTVEQLEEELRQFEQKRAGLANPGF